MSENPPESSPQPDGWNKEREKQGKRFEKACERVREEVDSGKDKAGYCLVISFLEDNPQRSENAGPIGANLLTVDQIDQDIGGLINKNKKEGIDHSKTPVAIRAAQYHEALSALYKTAGLNDYWLDSPRPRDENGNILPETPSQKLERIYQQMHKDFNEVCSSGVGEPLSPAEAKLLEVSGYVAAKAKSDLEIEDIQKTLREKDQISAIDSIKAARGIQLARRDVQRHVESFTRKIGLDAKVASDFRETDEKSHTYTPYGISKHSEDVERNIPERTPIAGDSAKEFITQSLRKGPGGDRLVETFAGLSETPVMQGNFACEYARANAVTQRLQTELMEKVVPSGNLESVLQLNRETREAQLRETIALAEMKLRLLAQRGSTASISHELIHAKQEIKKEKEKAKKNLGKLQKPLSRIDKIRAVVNFRRAMGEAGGEHAAEKILQKITPLPVEIEAKTKQKIEEAKAQAKLVESNRNISELELKKIRAERRNGAELWRQEQVSRLNSKINPLIAVAGKLPRAFQEGQGAFDAARLLEKAREIPAETDEFTDELKRELNEILTRQSKTPIIDSLAVDFDLLRTRVGVEITRAKRFAERVKVKASQSVVSLMRLDPALREVVEEIPHLLLKKKNAQLPEGFENTPGLSDKLRSAGRNLADFARSVEEGVRKGLHMTVVSTEKSLLGANVYMAPLCDLAKDALDEAGKWTAKEREIMIKYWQESTSKSRDELEKTLAEIKEARKSNKHFAVLSDLTIKTIEARAIVGIGMEEPKSITDTEQKGNNVSFAPQPAQEAEVQPRAETKPKIGWQSLPDSLLLPDQKADVVSTIKEMRKSAKQEALSDEEIAELKIVLFDQLPPNIQKIITDGLEKLPNDDPKRQEYMQDNPGYLSGVVVVRIVSGENVESQSLHLKNPVGTPEQASSQPATEPPAETPTPVVVQELESIPVPDGWTSEAWSKVDPSEQAGARLFTEVEWQQMKNIRQDYKSTDEILRTHDAMRKTTEDNKDKRSGWGSFDMRQMELLNEYCLRTYNVPGWSAWRGLTDTAKDRIVLEMRSQEPSVFAEAAPTAPTEALTTPIPVQEEPATTAPEPVEPETFTETAPVAAVTDVPKAEPLIPEATPRTGESPTPSPWQRITIDGNTYEVNVDKLRGAATVFAGDLDAVNGDLGRLTEEEWRNHLQYWGPHYQNGAFMRLAEPSAESAPTQTTTHAEELATKATKAYEAAVKKVGSIENLTATSVEPEDASETAERPEEARLRTQAEKFAKELEAWENNGTRPSGISNTLWESSALDVDMRNAYARATSENERRQIRQAAQARLDEHERLKAERQAETSSAGRSPRIVFPNQEDLDTSYPPKAIGNADLDSGYLSGQLQEAISQNEWIGYPTATRQQLAYISDEIADGRLTSERAKPAVEKILGHPISEPAEAAEEELPAWVKVGPAEPAPPTAEPDSKTAPTESKTDEGLDPLVYTINPYELPTQLFSALVNLDTHFTLK